MTERKPLTGVGYAVPPKTSQFKKGQSGNPKGRRKGSVALATLIRKSAKERVIVQENGARKSMTKDEAAFKQLFNKAASGDQRAIKLWEVRRSSRFDFAISRLGKSHRTPHHHVCATRSRKAAALGARYDSGTEAGQLSRGNYLFWRRHARKCSR